MRPPRLRLALLATAALLVGPAAPAQAEPPVEPATATDLLVAHLYLDAAGFHAMDETLHRGELDPRYLEAVRTTLVAVEALPWPDALRGELSAFVAAGRELEAALQAEDVEAAAEAAAVAHGTQHALSHAIFARLSPAGAAPGGHGAAGAQTVPEDARHFVLELRENGGAVGGAATYRVGRGDVVAFTLRSAAAGGLHLHGLDQEWELRAGEELVATFPAEAVGRFPLEFHPGGGGRGVVVGYLEVRP